MQFSLHFYFCDFRVSLINYETFSFQFPDPWSSFKTHTGLTGLVSMLISRSVKGGMRKKYRNVNCSREVNLFVMHLNVSLIFLRIFFHWLLECLDFCGIFVCLEVYRTSLHVRIPICGIGVVRFIVAFMGYIVSSCYPFLF